MRSGSLNEALQSCERTITRESVRSAPLLQSIGERPQKWVDSGVASPVSREIGHRFASLVDGEGCFSIRRANVGKLTPGFVCEFIVKMRADDEDFLRWLRGRLGNPGVIRTQPAYRGAGNRKPAVRWEINRKRELLWLTRVVDHFPLRSKKARDYLVWREAVIDWNAIGGGRADWSFIAACAKLLPVVRTYRERGETIPLESVAITLRELTIA